MGVGSAPIRAVRRRAKQIYRLLRYGERRRRFMREIQHIEKCRGAVRLWSYPHELFLDPCTMCNLRCPFCVTGNHSSKLTRQILELDDFERIFERLPLKHLEVISLFNWGEPLLNPHIATFIRRFHAAGKVVGLHTNFSAKLYSDAFLEELVKSGLEGLQVSADGATQESYAKYRVGGDLERVLQNMRRLAQAKERLGQTNPIVHYKLMLHRYNEHEVDAARLLAADVGAEFRVVEHFWFPPSAAEEWQPESMKLKHGQTIPVRAEQGPGNPIHTACHQMWDTLVVSADGNVYPCCVVSDPEHAVGNILTESFADIWNNDKMRYLRRYVVDEDAPPPPFPNMCTTCEDRFCTFGKPRF